MSVSENKPGEFEVPCRVVMVHMRCHCGGEYVWNKETHTNHAGTTYFHRCSGCGSSVTLPQNYPAPRFVEI